MTYRSVLFRGLRGLALSVLVLASAGVRASDATAVGGDGAALVRAPNDDPASWLLADAGAVRQGTIREVELPTKLLASPARYAVLFPPGYDDGDAQYPVLLLLHGGGGDLTFLTARMRGLLEEAWARGVLEPMVVVTPSAGRSFYLDRRDGSERWETFIFDELLPHVRATYRVSADSRHTLVAGISMGGMGALRLAFKHPDRFAGVAALEPGIEPALAYDDIELQDRFWRSEALFEELYGRPVDREYWKANNPANIAINQADVLRRSGLRIYLEVGDEDSFNLQRGAEFLHRVLVDNDIRHGYRWIDGADHTGATVPTRFLYAFAHLNQALSPAPADPSLGPLRQRIQVMKRAAGLEQ